MDKRISLETITAEEALSQSNASLRVINMISHALYRSLDFDTVVKKAAKAMDDFFHAPSVSIFLLNEKEQRLDQVFASDPDIEPARLIRTLPLEIGSLTALAVAHNKIVICEDVSKDEIMRPDVRAAIIKWGRKTILTLPLLFHDQVLGAMNLFFAEKRTFTPSEQETFLSIGKTIGLALTNARHVSQLQEEIAKRKKIEDELRKIQENLEELVQERTKELISANNELLEEIAERKQAQEALRISEEKYRLITENMSDMINVTDLHGVNMYISPSHLKSLGYSLEERLGKSVFDLLHPDDVEICVSKFAEFLANKQSKENVECRVKHADGYYIWLDSVANILKNDHGKTIGVVLSLRDVTERKLLEDALVKSEEKYRLITENIMDCIALADADGIFQYVTYSREILGYEPEEMIGKTGLSITHPDEKPRIERLYKEGIEKGWHELTYETKLRHKDGHYISMDVRARTLINPRGKVIGAVFAGRDITQFRQRDEEISCTLKLSFASQSLTLREKETLGWIMKGKSTWDISTILKISERTVKFHIDNIMKKLSAVNRTQAVAIALREKLIEFE